MLNGLHNEIILAARLLLSALFLVFGWRKLTDLSGTYRQMVDEGLHLPALVTALSTFMELPVAFAIAVGAFTRPLALLMALYTMGTAFIGHHYWTVKAAARVDSMDGFFKDLSIMGGFLLLYIAGPGKYSIDALYGIAIPWFAG